MKENNGSKFSMHLGDIRCVELIKGDEDSFLVIHERIDDKMNSFIINCSNVGHVQLFDAKFVEDDEYERIKF